jgi:hypothetical protein
MSLTSLFQNSCKLGQTSNSPNILFTVRRSTAQIPAISMHAPTRPAEHALLLIAIASRPSKNLLLAAIIVPETLHLPLMQKLLVLKNTGNRLYTKKSQIIVKWQDAPIFGSRIVQPTGNAPYGFETDFSKYTGAEPGDSISESGSFLKG